MQYTLTEVNVTEIVFYFLPQPLRAEQHSEGDDFVFT